MIHFRRLRADARGSSLVEFALALPVLSIMLVGLLDLGKYGLHKSALLQGTREGAQYAMISYSESANINTTTENATGLTGVTASNTVFCECVAGTAVSCGTTCGSGITLKRYITVTANKTFTSVLGAGGLNFGSLGSFSPPSTITASMTMIIP